MKTNPGNDRFKILHNGVAPRKGYVLISEPFLSETCFQRSVVLLTSHNEEEGSMGFILNKPTEILFHSLFPETPVKEDIHIPVFLGGPVGSDKLFFLHTLGNLLPDSLHICKDIYMNGDFSILCNYINSGNPLEGKVKFFLGYSGWSVNQLDEEIKENTWLVNKLAQSDIFEGGDDALWKKSLLSLDEEYRKWIYYPKSPYLN